MQACGGVHTPIRWEVGGPQALHGEVSPLLLLGCYQRKAKVHPRSCLDASSATMPSRESKPAPPQAQARARRQGTKLKLIQGQVVDGELVPYQILLCFPQSGFSKSLDDDSDTPLKPHAHKNIEPLVGSANRFARIDSQKKTPIFEALGEIRANRVFSPIRIEIRVIPVQSSPLRSIRKKKSFEAIIDFRESAHKNIKLFVLLHCFQATIGLLRAPAAGPMPTTYASAFTLVAVWKI